MGEGYLRTEDLSVGYDRRALIRDICLDIRKGEIIVLAGPNGSGKSTILKSLTRQLSLVSGSVALDGKDLERMNGKMLSKKLAVVLTQQTRPELMTCYEMVAAGRYPHTGYLGILAEEDRQKVEEALRIVHAGELGSHYFHELSDGQRQRILLARAICQEPEMIVLDEPTSFLDIRYKLELLSILRSMSREKKITVILSLHEIELAQKFADRVLCVKGETIFMFGPPEEVFEEKRICELYGLTSGSYDPLFGNLELPPPQGKPEIFVISGAGTGIRVFRRLQREQKPFRCGILYTNDVDYALARHLADQVVTEEPFMEISDQAVALAMKEIHASRQVICTSFPIGRMNRRVLSLIKEAEKQKKLKMETDSVFDSQTAEAAKWSSEDMESTYKTLLKEEE